MSEDRSQHEPSMEEILASIRKIISEDGDAERRDEASEAEGAEDEIAPSGVDADEDVLELTDDAAEDETLDLTEEIEEIGQDEPLAPLDELEMAPPPPPPPPPPEIPPEMPEEEIELVAEEEEDTPPRAEPKRDAGILSSSTEKAGMAAFSELAGVLATSRASHGITIEDLAKELLRPMLREWLDDNLPGLVEKIVKAEIQRMVDRADIE